jgi:hypothetical protein
MGPTRGCNSLVSGPRCCKRRDVLENHFGEEIAAVYDESSGAEFDPDVIARPSMCWPSSPATALRSS